MKKFKLEYIVTREFAVPDNATDEEYDAMKDTVVTGIVGTGASTEGHVRVKLIDAPDEIKEKYIPNLECQD